MRQVAGAQLIHRAAEVLRIAASGQMSGISLTDITDRSGLTEPTAHRILRALVEEGMVEQLPRTRRYVIGEQLRLLALARSTHPLLSRKIAGILQALANAIGDTVFLTIRTGRETLCIGRYLGTFPIQVLATEVGARRPMGVSASGVAMLAALGAEESETLIKENTRRIASLGIKVGALRTLVGEARQNGFAYLRRGLIPGTAAISVALPEPAAAPLATLTSAAINRRVLRREYEIVDQLRSAASTVRKHLS